MPPGGDHRGGPDFHARVARNGGEYRTHGPDTNEETAQKVMSISKPGQIEAC